jgi:60 kDa SS-A/Ro ribonucleoprotein
MRDPLARLSAVMTPQRRPLAGRDQVRNAAGGYVFAKDVWTQVEDFLILGTAGGTYYTGSDELTTANTDVLLRAIAEDGPRVVALISEISTAQPARAPKPRPCVFALAAAAAHGDAVTVQAVKGAFARVVRTTDHLAMFFGYWKNLAGKPAAGKSGTSPVIGRAMRTAFASWFAAEDVHDVAFRAVKARQRATPAGEAMALRDIIRIAHPVARTPQHATLLGWLAGRVSDDDARAVLADVDNFLAAQAVSTPAQAVDVIRERRVPWEFLPPDVLGAPEVWDELIGTIGLTALIRNLARMTRIGTIAPFAGATGRVTARLTDQRALARARVHPMDLYLALHVYRSADQPVPAITDALERAYELSFGNVAPSGRRLLVAVDSSGSMTHQHVVANGTVLGPAYAVASAIAAMLARIEGSDLHVIDVDTKVHASRVTPQTSLREIAGWRPSGGGTDLSLPFTWALERRLDVDGIVVLTDNETWAGRQHPVQALDAYRRVVNPAARVVVVSLTPVRYLIADHADDGVLAVAGLDAALPKVIAGFVR